MHVFSNGIPARSSLVVNVRQGAGAWVWPAFLPGALGAWARFALWRFWIGGSIAVWRRRAGLAWNTLSIFS